MTILVVGASGATGRLLVEQLLNAGQSVKVIVRPTGEIPDAWTDNDDVTLIKADIAKMHVGEMASHLADCHVIASCLGHNLTWNGIYGKPRKLVADSVRLLCEATIRNAPEKPMKLVLMNTAGNSNREINELVSMGQKMMVALIRFLLPPHRDNEAASDHLWMKIGQNHPNIQWAVVRPDTLTDEEEVTDYSLHQSPTRSAIYSPGKTSRINVGNFMARLIVDDDLWNKWKGQMPVIYNEAD